MPSDSECPAPLSGKASTCCAIKASISKPGPASVMCVRELPDRHSPRTRPHWPEHYNHRQGSHLLRDNRFDQSQAKALAEAGHEEGTVVVAEEQTRGKGRLERSWISPRRSNLLFSVILRPRCLPAQVFRLNMVASLSIVQALENLTPLKPLIKWPNDVYVGAKKLAGILTEFSGTADGSGLCCSGRGPQC